MKYDDLDMAILKAINGGIKTFTAIAYRVEGLAKPHARLMTETFRVVDRRLQALRKKGSIVFEKKEWKPGFRL